MAPLHRRAASTMEKPWRRRHVSRILSQITARGTMRSRFAYFLAEGTMPQIAMIALMLVALIGSFAAMAGLVVFSETIIEPPELP